MKIKLARCVFIIGLCVYFLALRPIASAQSIPSSARSKKAIERVTPLLTEELREKELSLGSPVFLRLFKESKRLEVFVEKGEEFVLFKSFPICYFSGDLGPKQKVGDLQAPEGFYFVRPSQLNPYSSYHLSFNLGYPNAYDRAHGRTGSLLMIHGDCVSIGCYAMTDQVIEEVFALMDAAYRNGQKFVRVHIFPFKMTDWNINRNRSYPWGEFWKNLKEGYDYFEEHKRPPNVLVKNRRYLIESGEKYY